MFYAGSDAVLILEQADGTYLRGSDSEDSHSFLCRLERMERSGDKKIFEKYYEKIDPSDIP